ncbi:hypothetical protein ACHAWF_003056 [Thalassiosira exigua]
MPCPYITSELQRTGGGGAGTIQLAPPPGDQATTPAPGPRSNGAGGQAVFPAPDVAAAPRIAPAQSPGDLSLTFLFSACPEREDGAERSGARVQFLSISDARVVGGSDAATN